MEAFLCASFDVIPNKFHTYSGVQKHEFRINNRSMRAHVPSAPGWPCDILVDGRWDHVYLPFTPFAAEVEALAILSSLDGETEREVRYVRIHSAYEAVVPARDPDVSALRHLLAHPVTQLTRPEVRSSLLRRFGALAINLRDYQHQKEFYRCIGKMLIEIDDSIYERLIYRWEELVPNSSEHDM